MRARLCEKARLYEKDGERAGGLWLRQRASAIVLAVCAPFFLVPFAGILGEGRVAVLAHFSRIHIAIFTLIFLIWGFYHLRLGLDEVITDYMHAPRRKCIARAANRVFCLCLGAIGAAGGLVIFFWLG